MLDCGWAEGLPDGKASLSLPSGATARGTVQHGVWDGDVVRPFPLRFLVAFMSCSSTARNCLRLLSERLLLRVHRC